MGIELSIVIPVYNEGTNITQVITGIEKILTIPHEVLLIYDKANDTTIAPALNLKKKYPAISLIKNKYHRGALNAIKTGFENARGKAVLVTMSDCSDDPKTIIAMLAKFNKGYDIICGSRYMIGGKKIGGPILKSLLSFFAGLTAKYMMGLPTYDLTNSFKLYRKSLIDKIIIESNGGFELGMEITLKGFFDHNAKITEVPTIWYDRTQGKSRFKLLSWLPSYINWYIWGLKKRYFSFQAKS